MTGHEKKAVRVDGIFTFDGGGIVEERRDASFWRCYWGFLVLRVLLLLLNRSYLRLLDKHSTYPVFLLR